MGCHLGGLGDYGVWGNVISGAPAENGFWGIEKKHLVITNLFLSTFLLHMCSCITQCRSTSSMKEELCVQNSMTYWQNHGPRPGTWCFTSAPPAPPPLSTPLISCIVLVLCLDYSFSDALCDYRAFALMTVYVCIYLRICSGFLFLCSTVR